MKTCTTCHVPKDLSCYNKNATKSDGLQTLCKDCSSARSRKYYADNREKHLKVVGVRAARQRNYIRQCLIDIKDMQPCMDCNVPYPFYVLEYDHVNGDKSYNVANMKSTFKIDTVLAEIAKCELVCANCHRQRTWDRLQESRV